VKGRVRGRSAGLVGNLPPLVPRRTLTLYLTGYSVSVRDSYGFKYFD
jgi:hypothetical protein